MQSLHVTARTMQPNLQSKKNKLLMSESTGAQVDKFTEQRPRTANSSADVGFA